MNVAVGDIEDFDRLLGERLAELGKIDAAGLSRAERLRDGGNGRLVGLLSQLGLVGERDVAQITASVLGTDFVEAGDMPEEPVLAERLRPRFLREHGVLPLGEDDDGIVLAMADPFDDYAINAVRLATGREILVRVAEPGVVKRAIDVLYPEETADGTIEVFSGDGDGHIEDDIRRLKDLASGAPVIRIVNELIARATDLRASDIHIEPQQGMLRVRYRVDGQLLLADAPPPAELAAAIISRVKIMAALDIAERRVPQDGRIQTVVRGQTIDLRISTMPTLDGESIVIRVLDRSRIQLKFDSLGIEGRNAAVLQDMLREPNGIILVTGPTGSGKTTTLYTALQSIDAPEKNIMTVEDPVEYRLDGIRQIQVHESIDLSFARVLRSVLRHDPDIIMVGEIRDTQTAEISVQAALTGHLVLSTLHTNDAVSSVTRLLDMGVEDFLLASSLAGVMAQRLVRTLCPDCCVPSKVPNEIADRFDFTTLLRERRPVFYRASGCSHCAQMGYLGQTSIMEAVKISTGLRELIVRRRSVVELRRAAAEEGMETMFVDGVRKAANGVTSLEEVMRVTRDASP